MNLESKKLTDISIIYKALQDKISKELVDYKEIMADIDLQHAKLKESCNKLDKLHNTTLVSVALLKEIHSKIGEMCNEPKP